MQSVAGCDLCTLHRQLVGKAMQPLSQFRKLLDQLLERLSVASVRRTVRLGYHSGWAVAVSHQQRQTSKAFPANETDFDRLSIRLNRQNGHHSCIHEVTRFDGFAGLVQHLMKLQTNEFQSGDDLLGVFARQTEQDFVGNSIPVAIGRVLYGSGRQSNLSRHNGSLRSANAV
ncbi:MAG TPA: hypothetical protein VJ999_03435 [Candidatus Sulfotelmatobacter sp.]|nr:hypothetical protein [Candidatus Sulfotelmatobacter sp.]